MPLARSAAAGLAAALLQGVAEYEEAPHCPIPRKKRDGLSFRLPQSGFAGKPVA